MSDASPRRRRTLAVGCALLALLSVCGCCVWAGLAGQADRRAFEGVDQVCAGVPATGVGAYPAASLRAAGARHEPDGRWRRDPLAIPSALEAETRGDVSVVVCVEPQRRVDDPPCTMSDVMFRTHTFPRWHYVAHARIVAAASAQALYEGEIASEMPACTLTSTGLVPDDGYAYEGEEIERDQVGAWLSTWIASPR